MRQRWSNNLDELDVKILRALISESAIAQSNVLVKFSLRRIAKRLGADDMTVSNRFRKLKESGAMSRWQLIVNPSFFGYKILDVMVDVQPESAKADMVKKLMLVHEIVGLINFYGKALKLLVMYNADESRSRTVELISRITNAESMAQSHMALPRSDTQRLTDTDIAIIRALANDARKSSAIVAKELGVSTRTVRNRVDRLRRENTIFNLPTLNIGGMAGLIPTYLSYAYANNEAKSSVDREMVSHFDGTYLWGGFADPGTGFIMLSAPTMVAVQKTLEWAQSQAGIASARVDIATDTFIFPEKLSEFLELRNVREVLRKNAPSAR